MTKSVSLSDEAYLGLRRKKRPGEPLSEAIVRLTTEEARASPLVLRGAAGKDAGLMIEAARELEAEHRGEARIDELEAHP